MKTHSALVGASARVASVALALFILFVPAVASAQIFVPTPLTTLRLRELARQNHIGGNHQGIAWNRAVGRAFQDFALHNLPGSGFLPENHRLFYSDERHKLTSFTIMNVVPDGVTDAPAGARNPWEIGLTTPYPNSSFIEVKAVRGTITLRYARWQIQGMLDALAHSPAGMASGYRRPYPTLTFIVTADTFIGLDVINEATAKKIALWQAVAMELPPGGRFQIAVPLCLNCALVYGPSGVAFPPPPGTVGTMVPTGPGVGGTDPPMLDDGFVGNNGPFSGPGNTTPNETF